MNEFRSSPGKISPELLALRLCRCHKLVGSARMFLEDNAIELLERTHPKNERLTVVSVGPGGCYQELVYLARLAKAGYKNIQLILIDPQVTPVEALQTLAKNHLPECSVRVKHYRSLEQYHQAAGSEPNLLLLLDLSDSVYKVNGQKLHDYAFSFLQQKGFLTRNPVIAYSDLFFDNVFNEHTPGVACCAYDGASRRLYDIPNQRALTPYVDRSISATMQ